MSADGLVLSLFPGIGLLDKAFEQEGFCVVRGPDLIWGGDIRLFHPPSGRFAGVIGGPPCQKFSTAARLIPGKTRQNLIPEFERCVSEARPDWFLMENVRGAPVPQVEGYTVNAILMNNRLLGEAQNRVRRFSLGGLGRSLSLQFDPDDIALFENSAYEYLCHCPRPHRGKLGKQPARQGAHVAQNGRVARPPGRFRHSPVQAERPGGCYRERRAASDGARCCKGC